MKTKTIKPLALTSVTTCMLLSQPVSVWPQSPEAMLMKSFSDTSVKMIYLDNQPIRALLSLMKGDKLYVAIDTLIPLGYNVSSSRLQTVVTGHNRLTIDNLRLTTDMNGVEIKLDLIQVDGRIFIYEVDFELLTGSSLQMKEGSCWLTSPTKFFNMITPDAISTIFYSLVDNGVLYVPWYVVLLALPSFKKVRENLVDTVSSAVLNISDFEHDGLFSVMKIVKSAGGEAVMTKQDGRHMLTVEHASTVFTHTQRQELKFSRALASIPLVKTDNIKEAVLHEINAYRVAVGKNAMVEGMGDKISGLTSFCKTKIPVPRVMSSLMSVQENSQLLMGDCTSVLINDVADKVDILVYA